MQTALALMREVFQWIAVANASPWFNATAVRFRFKNPLQLMIESSYIGLAPRIHLTDSIQF